MTLPPITPAMAFVFAVVAGALVLFATERVPVDVTAIGVMVALLVVEPLTALLADAGVLAGRLYVLHEPGDAVDPVAVGLSGFASPATPSIRWPWGSRALPPRRRSPSSRCSSSRRESSGPA
nr:hypothetical protein [Halomicrobium katesii]